MIGCTICFDEELGVKLLKERMKKVDFIPEGNPINRFTVNLKCPHGVEHHHAIYPASNDWDWAKAQFHKKGGQNEKRNGARR